MATSTTEEGSRTIRLTVDSSFPEQARQLLEGADLQLEPADLLPILSCGVHDAGEWLHEWGGTDGEGPTEEATQVAAKATTFIEALGLLQPQPRARRGGES